jgi:hypothetical protein
MRRVLAIIAGFLTTVVLAVATDVVMMVVFSSSHPLRLRVAGLVYTLVYAAVGGYVTARIAKARPMTAVLILAGIAFAISFATLLKAGTISQWPNIASLVLLVPCTLVGGFAAKR